MSAAYGYGLCGVLSPDLTSEQKRDCLVEFATKGLAPVFHEVIDEHCLRVSWNEADGVSVEERNDSEAESIIASWGPVGSFSYDEWEMLESDILVPGSTLEGDIIRAVSLTGLSEGQRVRGVEAAREYVRQHKDNFSFADYLVEMMTVAIEKKILFTIAA